MLVERPLDDTPEKDLGDANDLHFQTTDDPEAARKFLEANPFAKLLIFLQTHSLENGAFVYTALGGSLEGCRLLEVRSSIPPHSRTSQPI